MKVTVTKKIEVEVVTLHVLAGVRYWIDATVNGVEDVTGELIPCRNGDSWEPVIDLESGRISNWEIGKTADIHYKVCDDGKYLLKDAEGNIVVSLDGYVPIMMDPDGGGYGDYIIMRIDENGVIANWKPDLEDFNDQDDE